MVQLAVNLDDCADVARGREEDLQRAIVRNDMGAFMEAAPEGLVKLFGGLFDVGVCVSRAPSFQRRFREILNAAMSAKGGAGTSQRGQAMQMV